MTDNGLLHTIAEGIKDMCYIWAKEMRSMITDEGMLIFCILVSLGYPLLYSWIYNNETVRDVPVAVVDMSHTAASREFIRDVDGSADTKVAYFCQSLQEARKLTGRQQVKGVVFIPADFDTKLQRGEQTTVSVYCDMSLMLTYKAIYQTTQAVASDISANIQIARAGNMTNRDDVVTASPIDIESVPIFNTTGGYGNAILPGVLVLILQQTLLLGIGLSAGTARENNRYRDLVPISKHYNGIFRIVLGKGLCYFMIYTVMAAYVLLAVPRFFHFTSLVTARSILMLAVPFLIAVIFFGMTVSCLVKYRENVMLLVVFTSVPLLFMSGISWPLSNMPGVWQGVAMLFPSTFGIRGFLAISSMGADIEDIAPDYHALWIQAVVYFFMACMVYRYQIISSRLHALESVGNIKDQIARIRAARKKKE